MSVKKILQKARKLIAKGWTQGAFARNDRGWSVGNNSPDAQCFCAVGAIRTAAGWDGNAPMGEYREALSAVRAATGSRLPIPSWNDNAKRTKEDVLAAFDKAIEASK